MPTVDELTNFLRARVFGHAGGVEALGVFDSLVLVEQFLLPHEDTFDGEGDGIDGKPLARQSRCRRGGRRLGRGILVRCHVAHSYEKRLETHNGTPGDAVYTYASGYMRNMRMPSTQ
jgi:hypothetical protein